MLFELIATIVAGFAGAGVALLINRMLVGRLPRWIVPTAAGAAMLATTTANEYGWHERTVAALPPGLEVAMTVEDRAIYRPWARVFPLVLRFLAVDRATMRSNDALPDWRMAEVYAFGRWHAPRSRLVMVDCDGGRRADITTGAEFGEDGAIDGLAWRDTGLEDPIVRTACAG
ncbi:MAG: hypothetical protein OXD36_05610 [Rhodobacter sp.]|nr:hypothetical protein [Rhodobacter sp.]MCY4241201.1 hypothetical protein [Rhodobacter sp.]